MGIDRTKLKKGLTSGMQRGWNGFVWIMRILVPVSFLTAVIAWSGYLSRIDFIVQPFMSLLHLPTAAALPILIGMLTNIYGGIAAMAVLPFSVDQMTLMAIFLLVAHNLIQEGIIQAKSGIHPFKATAFRIVGASITVIAVAPFFNAATMAQAASSLSHESSRPFVEAAQDWGTTTLSLSIKIFVIIMCMLTLLEILKTFDLINAVLRFLTPVLRVMGLNQKVGFLWLTAVVFGVAYGGAVIVEEARAGQLSKEELEELHLSIGINHALVEDPALFLSLGLNPFWLWVPRIIAAIIMTRLLTLWHRLSLK